MSEEDAPLNAKGLPAVTGKELPEHPESVRGLMDAQMVSNYLGLSRGTLRSWLKRRIEGTPGGPPKDFPSPIDARLGGSALWDEPEVVAYRRRREAAKTDGKMVGRSTGQVETGV